MYGPLEYVVVQLAGNGFSGEILPSLMDMEEWGCVQLVDLTFISKDEVGELTLLEINDLEEEDAEKYELLIGEFHGVLSKEDVATAAVDLPENSSAVVMLFEHLWAVGLQQSVLAAGGRMLDSGYIHPQTQAEVIAEVTEVEDTDAA